MTYYEKHVFVCTNQKAPGKQCCADNGGERFFDYLKERLKILQEHGPGKIRVTRSGCLGRCSQGPCIVVYPEGAWYTYHSFADLDEIIQKSLVQDGKVERLLLDRP